MGDCPGPRKETATQRNVTQGGALWACPPWVCREDSIARSQSPVVGVPGLCWLRRVLFVRVVLVVAGVI